MTFTLLEKTYISKYRDRTPEHLAAKMGHSVEDVRRHMILARYIACDPEWTNEQKRQLAKTYRWAPMYMLIKMFGKSKDQISRKGRSMGLRRDGIVPDRILDSIIKMI